MDAATALVAIIGTIAGFGAPVALLYLWLHRPSAKKQLGAPRAADAAMEARLERIEVAIQAIAMETERIAEGQRFTTKLLTAAPGRHDVAVERIGA